MGKTCLPTEKTSKKGEHHMSTEVNKTLALRLIEEVVHPGKLSILDELITADAIDHRLPPRMPPSREGVKLLPRKQLACFSLWQSAWQKHAHSN